MEPIGTLPNVPLAALPTIADELRKFGAIVVFETPRSGYVQSISGSARFFHDGWNELSVFLVEDFGHFPFALIVGGTRQIVYEGVELYQRKPRRAAGGVGIRIRSSLSPDNP